MKQRELVRTLLHKAAQDEAVLDELLPHPRFDDATVGFHAQQAVEKLLKAWLAHLGIDFPKVHRLETLVALLAAHGESLPSPISDLGSLTPFGTFFRYDDLPCSTEVDRVRLLQTVQDVRVFVESQTGLKAQ